MRMWLVFLIWAMKLITYVFFFGFTGMCMWCAVMCMATLDIKDPVKWNLKVVLSSLHHRRMCCLLPIQVRRKKNTDKYVKLGFEIVRKSALFSAWYWGGRGRVAWRSWSSAPSNVLNLATTATLAKSIAVIRTDLPAVWVFYVIYSVFASYQLSNRMQPPVIWRR